jgi:hypothetical protein
MSWFKKHFTCIRAREISDLDNEHYKNTVIQSIRNDLKSDLLEKKLYQNKNQKNSNEYRDYTKNCEGKFLANTFYNLNIDNNRLINQRVNICDKQEHCSGSGGSLSTLIVKKDSKNNQRHECTDEQCK